MSRVGPPSPPVGGPGDAEPDSDRGPTEAAQQHGLDRFIEREAWQVWYLMPEALGIDDLRNAGHLGLLEARERFDSSLGVPFFGYARHRIRGAMFDAVRSAGYGLRRRPNAACRRAALAHEVLGPPTPETADPATGQPDRTDDAEQAYRAVARLATAFLVDMAVTPPPDPGPGPEQVVVEATERALLNDALAGVTPEDREVLAAVYDFDEVGDSGARLAARLGLSRSQVSRRHQRALDRLRRLMHPGPAP